MGPVKRAFISSLVCGALCALPMCVDAQDAPSPVAPRPSLEPAPGYEEWTPVQRRGLQLAVSAATTAMVVPSRLMIGRGVGENMTSLTGVFVGGVLPLLVLVPLATVGAGSLVAGDLVPGSGPMGWATLATTGAHAGLMALGVFGLGVDPVYNAPALVGFVAIESVVLPLVSTLVMAAASRPVRAPSARAASARVPLPVVPLVQPPPMHTPIYSVAF